MFWFTVRNVLNERPPHIHDRLFTFTVRNVMNERPPHILDRLFLTFLSCPVIQTWDICPEHFA
jgi:hypothetical protein